MMVLACTFSLSIPIPALDLDDLTKNSDMIVSGEVLSLQEAGSTTIRVNSSEIRSHILAGRIHVARVLKGETRSPELSFQFYAPEVFVGWRSAELHTFAVFFFRARPTGNFEFTSPYHPFALAIPGTSVAGSTPIDRVIAEIDGAVASPTTSVEQKLTALFFLSRSRSAASNAALRSVLQYAEPRLRLTAAAALLERNDISGLALAAEALLHGSPGMSEVISHNLAYAIGEGVKDPKAIPALTKLLNSRDPELRRAAASALMRTQSSEAIGPLLAALGDSDFDVRYYSVVGLAEITGQTDWRPNREAFLADQETYLRHWRGWGQNR